MHCWQHFLVLHGAYEKWVSLRGAVVSHYLLPSPWQASIAWQGIEDKRCPIDGHCL